MFYGVFANLTKDKNAEFSSGVVSLIKKLGQDAEVFTEVSAISEKRYGAVIPIGGDGTVLSVATVCVKCKIPLFPINLGTLGYLASAERGNYEAAVTALVKGEVVKDGRCYLHIEQNGEDNAALNEVVVGRGQPSKLLKTR
ncbi:MAG: NAD(+)/NADH kinase, partial [Christensenellaceae bacterium]|nr:NAD(+)/NADH kinase [Christensenellaceae bacterium]